MNNRDLTPLKRAAFKKTAEVTVIPPARLTTIKDMLPGDHLSINVTVQNTGNTDAHYFITAEWYPPDKFRDS